jgi:hypothetical protein
MGQSDGNTAGVNAEGEAEMTPRKPVPQHVIDAVKEIEVCVYNAAIQLNKIKGMAPEVTVAQLEITTAQFWLHEIGGKKKPILRG